MIDCLFLASIEFTLLPLILTTTLIVVIISLIHIIFLNKRLLDSKRDSINYQYNTGTSTQNNLSNELKTSISSSIDIIEKMKGAFTQKHDDESLKNLEMLLQQSEKLKSLIQDENFNEITHENLIKLPSGCFVIHKPVKSSITTEDIIYPDSIPNKINGCNLNIDSEFLTRITSLIYREITNTENIIEIITSELYLSSSQLNRRIKLLTGITTSHFILKTRLNRAKKQLLITSKPIGEVAIECGFNDFAYFSRSFKKEFGMTPTTFQRIPHSAT